MGETIRNENELTASMTALAEAHPVTAGNPPKPTPLRPVVATIPRQLAEVPHWLVWTYEFRPGSAGRPGKWTKVPRKPDGSGMARSTHPEDWGPLSEAEATYGASPGRFAGVGFGMTESLGWVGVDLDHCLTPDGTLAAWAASIVDRLDSYTERTPGGDGLRVWVQGTLPIGGWHKKQGLGDERRGAVEVYSTGRYFTVTGVRWGTSPERIEERAQELATFLAEWAPPALVAAPERATLGASRSDRAVAPEAPEDAVILRRARSARTGEKFSRLWNGELSDHDGDHSAADLSLCSALAFWCGPIPERIDALFRGSGLMRPKWDETHGSLTYGAMTVQKALTGRTEFYVWSRATAPTITIGTDERRVNDEAIAALTRDSGVYERGGMLVKIRRILDPVSRGLRRAVGAPTIATITPPSLREILASNAQWVKINAEGEVKPAHPPEWSVAAVASRGEWPGIRPLGAVVECPTLRYDGTVLDTPGYDADSGLFLAPNVIVSPRTEAPSRDAARAAAREILEVVQDFPFANDAHRSAWLAALLTPLARCGIAGNVPFFMIDATTPGSGKGMLADIIAVITSGRLVSKIDYPDDDAEMRKSLLAVALEGDALILFDNIASPFGGSALDGALTAGSIKGRILGTLATTTVPVVATFLGTGNNVEYRGDFLRRVVPIRLEPVEERPEERTGFAHPSLMDYVEQERGRLVGAALTVLRAYIAAGRPDQHLTAFGSFEAWSGLIRSSVHWVTDHDPCATRAELTSHDPEAQARRGLILGWAELTEAEGGALTTNEALKLVDRFVDSYPTLQEALQGMTRDGSLPSARVLGNRLPKLRGRVIEGKRLESVTLRSKALAWKVVTVGISTLGADRLPSGPQTQNGGSGGSGGSFSNTQGVIYDKCTLSVEADPAPPGEIHPPASATRATRATRATTPLEDLPPQTTQNAPIPNVVNGDNLWKLLEPYDSPIHADPIVLISVDHWHDGGVQRVLSVGGWDGPELGRIPLVVGSDVIGEGYLTELCAEIEAEIGSVCMPPDAPLIFQNGDFRGEFAGQLPESRRFVAAFRDAVAARLPQKEADQLRRAPGWLIHDGPSACS